MMKDDFGTKAMERRLMLKGVLALNVLMGKEIKNSFVM